MINPLPSLLMYLKFDKRVLGIGYGTKFIVNFVLSIILAVLLWKINTIPENIHILHLYELGDSDSTFVNIELGFNINKDSATISNGYGNCEYELYSFKFNVKPNIYSFGSNSCYILGKEFIYNEFKNSSDYEELKKTIFLKNDVNIDSIKKVFVIDHSYNNKIGINKLKKPIEYTENIDKNPHNHNYLNIYDYYDSLLNMEMQHSRTILTYTEGNNVNDSIMRKCYSHGHSMYHNKLFNIIALYDISQAYYMVRTCDFFGHLTDRLNNRNELSLHFGSAIEPSHINVEPDRFFYDGFKYTDINKLYQIDSNGIIFHIKFRQFENLQMLRNFVLTTALGFCFALCISSLWRFIWRRSLRRRIQKNRIVK